MSSLTLARGSIDVGFRFLHIAHVHLDSAFKRHDTAFQSLLRESIASAFRSAVDLAIERGVDAMLIAGDLFDSDMVTFATGGLSRQPRRAPLSGGGTQGRLSRGGGRRRQREGRVRRAFKDVLDGPQRGRSRAGDEPGSLQRTDNRQDRSASREGMSERQAAREGRSRRSVPALPGAQEV